MERRNFLKAVGLGLGGAVAAAPATAQPATAQPAAAQSRPEIRWRMATGFPTGLDTLNAGAEFLARRVGALTGGAFRIRVHAADDIVSRFGVLDAVSSGEVPIGFTAGSHYADRDPALVFDTALPFGLNTRQRNAWMYHGGGRELMRRIFADHGVIPIPAGNTGAQMGGWFRREVNTLQDLNGLKFRVGGMAGDILGKLGAVPGPVADTDLRAALQSGAIDAVEWGGPQDDLRLGLHKAARYYYYPGFWEASAQISCCVGLRRWERLPEEYRAALESACAETSLWITARYDADNPAALKQLVAEGALLRPYPLDVLKAAYRATREHLKALAARDARFGMVHASWARFRDDQRLWFRVAEHSFDRFISLVAADGDRP
ncbi:MAG TPA: twin-arginine translocation signal domain-containing protein [Azospirillum sp.]